MIVIGLAGRAGSGKDTCADWLVRHAGAVKYSFAEPLKRLAMEVFGWSEAQCFGTQEEKERIDPRVTVIDEMALQRAFNEMPVHLKLIAVAVDRVRDSTSLAISARQSLIRLGDGARKWIGPLVWVTACLDRIQRERPSVAVISDVRYANEAKAIQFIGSGLDDGHVIRLACLDADSKVDPNAPSERSVDEIPAELLAADLVVPRSPGARLLLDAFEREMVRLGVVGGGRR